MVFKRRDAPYRPRRRSPAWRKVKHRRQETLELLAWRPGEREPNPYVLGRPGLDGTPRFAGAVQLGLGRA